MVVLAQQTMWIRTKVMMFFSDPEVIAKHICLCEPANKSVDSSCCQKESVEKFVDGAAEDAHDVVHVSV